MKIYLPFVIMLSVGALLLAPACSRRTEDPEELVAELLRIRAECLATNDWDPYYPMADRLIAAGEPCAPALTQLLRSDDPATRVEGVYYLKLIGSGAIPGILGVLRDPTSSATAKADAITTLELIGDPIAVPELSELLDDPDYSVRFKTAKALVKLGSPKGVAFLTTSLKDPDPDIRGSAILYISDVVDERMLLPLVEAMEDPDPFVRDSAVNALGRLLDPRSVPYLRDIGLKDEAAAIRKRSAEVLMDITEKQWTYIDEYGREVAPR